MVNNCGVVPDCGPKNDSASGSGGTDGTVRINAIAPVLLARAIEPLLKRDAPAHFASLSARVGISDNRSGGWYGYRAAKAAQTVAQDAQPRMEPSLAAGHGDPSASRHDGHGPLQTLQSFVALDKPFNLNVQRINFDVLMEQTPDSGVFMAWDGQPIGW